MLIKIKDNNQTTSQTIKIPSNYTDYYRARKTIFTLSQQMNFGLGTLPASYTEGLCNHIYSMTSSTGKDRYKADSIDSNGKYIEIKCTQHKNNNGTINKKAKYDYLMWIHIDYLNDKIIVKKFARKDVLKCIQSLNSAERKKNRPTINFNNITNCCSQQEYIIKTDSNSTTHKKLTF